MMTPEQLARPNTEHAHQIAFFCWLNTWIREGKGEREVYRWVYAVPNGGDRDRAVAGRLKAEGVTSGVWDVCVPIPRGNFHSCYLELKKPGREKEKWGGLSDIQRDFGIAMLPYLVQCELCHGWEPMRDAFLRYDALGAFTMAP